MDWLLIFEIVSFIVCLPLIFIGVRKLTDIKIGDLLGILLASILPLFNIFLVLVLFEDTNKVLFKRKE